VRAQECGQPCEPRRRPGIGRPGRRRLSHGGSLAGTGFEQTGVPQGLPGGAGRHQRESNAMPPDRGPRWSCVVRLSPAIRARVLATVRASGG
jgi:hypothetical protein